mgnify:CR=1 FL=1
MSITKYKDTWFHDPLFLPGDEIEVVSSKSTHFALQPGIRNIVDKIEKDINRQATNEINPEHNAHTPYGRTVYVYYPRYVLRNVTGSHSTSRTQFKKVQPMLQITKDRPCVVWEIDNVADDKGVVTVTRKGDPTFFDNYTSAQAWVSQKIKDAIRSSNTYPSYSILEEKSVAQAKEPPISFE